MGKSFKFVKFVKYAPLLAFMTFFTRSTTAQIDISPDNQVVSPYQSSSWLQELLIEDQTGTLGEVKNQVRTWQTHDEYLENWDMEDVASNSSPDEHARKKYLKRRLLKYLDHRVRGELKDAKKNSAFLRGIDEAQQAVSPSGSVSVNNVKVRFSAQLLRGRAMLRLVNPYLHFTTHFRSNGEIVIHMWREFADWKIRSDLDIRPLDNYYRAKLSRPLGPHINAALSSEQDLSSIAFLEHADLRMGFDYALSF